MNILQLCNKFPYPPNDGGVIATLNLTKAFADLGHDVTVLAMNTPKHFFDLAQLPQDINKTARFHAVSVDTAVTAKGAIKAFVKNKSYHVERFTSDAFAAALKKILQTQPFDIIQLEGLYLAVYADVIRKHSRAKIVMRAHNVEFKIWEQLAAKQSNVFNRIYLSILARQLRKHELKMLSHYDCLVPISDIDAAFFKQAGFRKPVHVCPASFDEEKLHVPMAASSNKSVFFIGSLDWVPNQDGLNWFVENVWKKNTIDASLHIAGRNMPDFLYNLNSQSIVVEGEVESSTDFMASKQIMVVPLFAGSGMRVKIIEAMAMGKTIVSTMLGAEGIAYTPNENIIIANTETEFAAALKQLTADGEQCKRIGERARQLAIKNYGAKITTQRLIDFYRQLA
jgi:polysaccharide biosynthesis protein PslH